MAGGGGGASGATGSGGGSEAQATTTKVERMQANETRFIGARSIIAPPPPIKREPIVTDCCSAPRRPEPIPEPDSPRRHGGHEACTEKNF
jgi:hypothetical protein